MPTTPEPDEKPGVRRALGLALMEFIQFFTTQMPGDMDDVMRQVATEKFRQAVMHAAEQGIEVSLPWHTLGVWTEDGKERIGAFSRALACVRREKTLPPPHGIHDPWTIAHTEAECLYEIGRVHFHEESPDAAREFLQQALPLAQQAETLRTPGKQIEDGLEGKIAALLMQV